MSAAKRLERHEGAKVVGKLVAATCVAVVFALALFWVRSAWGQSGAVLLVVGLFVGTIAGAWAVNLEEPYR